MNEVVLILFFYHIICAKYCRCGALLNKICLIVLFELSMNYNDEAEKDFFCTK